MCVRRFADWLTFATKVDGARVNVVLLLLLFWERMRTPSDIVQAKVELCHSNGADQPINSR
jgi:hypothetical protein